MTELEKQVYLASPRLYFACKARAALRVVRLAAFMPPSIDDTDDTQERLFALQRKARNVLGVTY
jgi:hypothetical protein